MTTILIDFQVLSIISLKGLIKYTTMQPDWSLRSLFLPKARTNYEKEILNIRLSGARPWNTIKEDIKSASLKFQPSPPAPPTRAREETAGISD